MTREPVGGGGRERVDGGDDADLGFIAAEAGGGDRGDGDGRDPRRARGHGDERAAAIEEAEDGRLHRVGGSRRVRMELIAIGIGAVFVFGALLKPWAGSPPSTPPSAAPSEAIAAATANGSSPKTAGSSAPSAAADTSTDGDGDHDGSPGGPIGPGTWTIATAPPWLANGGRGQVVIVDWTTLLGGDTNRAWGIAVATLADHAARSTGTTVVAPTVSWTPRSPSGTIEPPQTANGRVLALAVTWPSSVHPSAVTFEYLGSDPSLYPWQGAAPFTALRLADALVSPARANLGAVASGTYWLPPSSTGPGAELAPPNTALTAGWPAGDYIVRVVAGSHTVVLPLRLQGH